MSLAFYTSAVSADDAVWGGAELGELPPGIFARIGGEDVPMESFKRFLADRLRQRYYHGRIPHDRLEQAHNEIVEEFLDVTLLKQEALRRKLTVDEDAVEQRLAQALANNPAASETAVSLLRTQLREHEYLQTLEQQVKNRVAEPERVDVERYYSENKEKFTTPAQWGLSLILIKVPPYAPVSDWESARQEGEAVHKALRDGVPFAELAHKHSDDPSAETGGDLGMVHTGMLSQDVADVVQRLAPGEVTPPIVILQGVAVLKLNSRVEARLNSFERVQQRARALLKRELAQRAWEALIQKLRATTPAVLSASAVQFQG